MIRPTLTACALLISSQAFAQTTTKQQAPGASNVLNCVKSLNDASGGSCIEADSAATFGKLLPYPGLNNLFNPSDESVVAGGESNTASGTRAVVGGGFQNSASGDYGVVGGGQNNLLTNNFAAIGGGSSNEVSGTAATVGGGVRNHATQLVGVVGGGYENRAYGVGAFIGGGFQNIANGGISTISGGRSNTTSQSYSTISGGRLNSVSAGYSTVAGGAINSAEDMFATIGGGLRNSATGKSSTVGGGADNLAQGNYSSVGGGSNNVASGPDSTVGGGESNTASQLQSTVGGGVNNTASGFYSTVGGGRFNLAIGTGSMVPGGVYNTAVGGTSCAAGFRAKANHDGAFVWGDSWLVDKTSSAADQFNVYASGGTRIFSNPSATAGVLLAPGGGAWTSVSDRNAKENFAQVDGQAVLDKLAAIPISTWNYKAQADSVRHMGPMAQDFYAAFGLGVDEKGIDTIDPDGVAFAAIQALNHKVTTKDEEIALLREELATLRGALDRLTTDPE